MASVSSKLLQGGGSTSFVQGAPASGSKTQSSGNTLQVGNAGSLGSQPTVSGSNLNTSPVAGGGAKLAASTSPDTGVATAQAAAAAQAAQAGALRGNITDLVNTIKSLLGARYGEIDSAAQEQAAKLDQRYATESGQLVQQATDSTNEAGGSFAARGTRDSSDYGNTVDKITNDANTQITGLGSELSDNKAAVGGEVLKEKAALDAQGSSYDTILAQVGKETDADKLTELKNQIDNQLTTLRAGSADNATEAASRSALETIAPSSTRAQQLKTTLSSIVGGSAPTAQKTSVATTLLNGANIPDDEKRALLSAFQSDLGATDPNKQQE